MRLTFQTFALFLVLCAVPAFGTDYSYTLSSASEVLDLQTTAGNTYTVNVKLGNPSLLTGLTYSGDGDIILQQKTNERVNIGTANTGFSGTLTMQNGNLSTTAVTSGKATAYGTSTIVLEKAVLMNASNTYEVTNNIQLKGNGGTRVGFSDSHSLTLSGTISDFSSTVPGTMNIAMDSGVTVINNGNNSYTGGTIIGSTLNPSGGNGRLRLGENADAAGSAKTPLGTSYVTFGTTGSVLNLNGQSVTIYGFKDTTAGYGTLSNGTANALTLTLNVGTDKDYTYSGLISGSGAINLVKEGAGSQTFKAANTNGTVTVNEGSMIYDLGATGTGTLGAVKGAGTFKLSSGAMAINTTTTASDALNLNVASGAKLTVNQKYTAAANNLTDTTFTGAGTLVFNAPGAYRMSFQKSSDFAGTFWFKNGQLSADSNGVSGGKVVAFGSSTIVLENAVLMNANNSVEYTNNIQIKGNGGARVGWGDTKTLTISGTISDYPGSTGVFNASNDQGLIVINNGNNTYTGGTIVGSSLRATTAAARLKLGEKADEGSKTPFGTGPVAIRFYGTAEATLDLNGQSVTIYGLNNKSDEMSHGILTNSGAACALTLDVGEGLDYAYGGKITVGNGITLVKTGSGSQTLSGDISGLNIEIQEGTINTPGTTSAASVSVSSGGTLRLVTDGETMDSLTAGTITLPADMVLSLEFLDGSPLATDEFQILKQTNPFTYTAEYLTGLLPASQSYWTLRVDGNAVYASVSANSIPEPATWVLLLLGGVLLVYKRVR